MNPWTILVPPVGNGFSLVEDTDGHRWLVNPAGDWIASFVAETELKHLKAICYKLNS